MLGTMRAVVVEDEAKPADEVGEGRGRLVVQKTIAVGDLDKVGANPSEVVAQRRVKRVGNLGRQVGGKAAAQEAAQLAKTDGQLLADPENAGGIGLVGERVERETLSVPAGDHARRQGMDFGGVLVRWARFSQ